jgi:site-specific recombinase XerD
MANNGSLKTKDTIGGIAEIEELARSFEIGLRARRRSPRTRQSYMEAIGLFVRFLQENGIPTDTASIHREYVEEFVAEKFETILPRSGKPMRPTTRANRYGSLHAFFEWLVENEEISRSPMEKMKPPLARKAPRDVLTLEQIETSMNSGRTTRRPEVQVTGGANQGEICISRDRIRTGCGQARATSRTHAEHGTT